MACGRDTHLDDLGASAWLPGSVIGMSIFGTVARKRRKHADGKSIKAISAPEASIAYREADAVSSSDLALPGTPGHFPFCGGSGKQVVIERRMIGISHLFGLFLQQGVASPYVREAESKSATFADVLASSWVRDNVPSSEGWADGMVGE